MQEQQGAGQKPKRVNPWKTIWGKPEVALDYVLRFRREEFLHRLYMGYGFVLMLALRLPDWLQGRPHIVGLMIQMLLIGPLLGLFIGYLQANMLGLASKWLGDPVEQKLIRPLIAWTNLPFALAAGLFILLCLIVNAMAGPGQPTSGMPQFQGANAILLLVPTLLLSAYAVWIRNRAIQLLFSADGARALLLWFLSSVLTYLPILAIALLYFTIFYATIARPGE